MNVAKILLSIILFLLVVFFGKGPWHLLLLTGAQIVYVPLTLKLILTKGDWFSKFYPFISIPAYLSIVLIQLTTNTEWDVLLAAVYLLFTFVVALYGLSRFFMSGFTHIEEFSINMAMMYLGMGGIWFFAFTANIDTGFTPMLTWLTAIHFHYSAFLLPIFVGFLGRIYKPRSYSVITSIILIAPMIVALGITFSIVIELLSVIAYMIGIYGLIHLSFQAPYSRTLQKWLVCLSFTSLGITILFSLLYASGNLFGTHSISIDFMLRFHGFVNTVGFALIGIIGWSISIPPTTVIKWTFPISKIRGKHVIGENILAEIIENNHYQGLIDHMGLYEPEINRQTLAPRIIDFYENTNEYRLFAKVKWQAWFKPFAIIYRPISRSVKQIDLPLSNRQIEMTGEIFAINDEKDGRANTRAWVRKIKEEIVFVALYSTHEKDSRTYMNISLPLPWSAMIGILELNQIGNELQLSSKKVHTLNADSGIYLAIKHWLVKLPIDEQFHVKETADGTLVANHTMWIFSIPFLKIEYVIYHNNDVHK
ncbi:YndJ family protein [Bacillus cihuensis]|uniref:YndJ family protein n=1 Tax=Bacillus cihuensis TaxID=1208599 RepID=UPI000414FA0A|nr:YndJ family protein [Bacillus cihuensis]